MAKKGLLIIGRFSGIHRGHIELIKRAKLDHPNYNIIVGVVAGKKSSKDLTKNPFSFDQRKSVIEKILNKLQIKATIVQISNAYIPDLVKLLKEEYNIEIDYLYCGSDRIESYAKQKIENLGIKIVSIDRNEKSDNEFISTETASGTKIRDSIKENNFDLFIQLMPQELDDDSVNDIWDILRNDMAEKGIINSTLIGGISHIEDLNVDKFINVLKNFYNKNIIAVQKLDGTFNASIVKDNDEIYIARVAKGQLEPIYYDNLPENPIFNALRGVCLVFDNKDIIEVLNSYLDNGDIIDLEVLYGAQPNAIKYDLKDNYLAFLRYIDGKGGQKSEQLLDDIYKALKPYIVNVDNDIYYFDWDTETIEVETLEESWKFTKPEILDKYKIKMDLTDDLELLEKWLAENNEIINDMTNLEVMSIKLNKIPIKLRPEYKEARQAALDKSREYKLNIKNKMIEKIFEHVNFDIGGKEQEGLVIRDLETGEMTKLIDRNKFTKTNKEQWYYMELAGDGIKSHNEYVPGIVTEFFNLNSELLDIPMLKLRHKFFNSIKNGPYNFKTNVINYLELNDKDYNNISDKFIVLKRAAINAQENIKTLKNESINDEKLTEFSKKRTLNSLGIVYTDFKTYVTEVQKLIDINNIPNTELVAEYLLLLFKIFGSMSTKK